MNWAHNLDWGHSLIVGDDLSIARSNLDELEKQLLECLLLGEEVPPNVDLAGASETGRVLSCKRKRSIERAYPCLVESLGNAEFGRIYSRYVQRYPCSHELGALPEARRFGKFMSFNSIFLLRTVLSLLDNIDVLWERIGVRPIKTRIHKVNERDSG